MSYIDTTPYESSSGMVRYVVRATASSESIECSWCGAHGKHMFIYRAPGQLNFRLPPRLTDPAFCNRTCWRDYHGH
jgi:hypothetical protein